MRLCIFLLGTVLFAQPVAGLKWSTPQGWKPEAARPMRAATYSVPLSPGDNGPAECAVYFFGQGSGGGKFFITLEANGDATKSIGANHGSWTLVDGEARITWDDGWHDMIRKVGTRHEKVAFEPGKSFDDAPSNVTAARNTDPRPI